jgi:hypothetical protein
MFSIKVLVLVVDLRGEWYNVYLSVYLRGELVVHASMTQPQMDHLVMTNPSALA